MPPAPVLARQECRGRVVTGRSWVQDESRQHTPPQSKTGIRSRGQTGPMGRPHLRPAVLDGPLPDTPGWGGGRTIQLEVRRRGA